MGESLESLLLSKSANSKPRTTQYREHRQRSRASPGLRSVTEANSIALIMWPTNARVLQQAQKAKCCFKMKCMYIALMELFLAWWAWIHCEDTPVSVVQKDLPYPEQTDNNFYRRPGTISFYRRISRKERTTLKRFKSHFLLVFEILY